MDETQLLTFLQSFAIAEIVPVPVHVVEATERTPRGPPAPPLPALDFSGAGALGRDQFISKLKEAIYPGTGHHREGALSRQRPCACSPPTLAGCSRLTGCAKL